MVSPTLFLITIFTLTLSTQAFALALPSRTHSKPSASISDQLTQQLTSITSSISPLNRNPSPKDTTNPNPNTLLPSLQLSKKAAKETFDDSDSGDFSEEHESEAKEAEEDVIELEPLETKGRKKGTRNDA